MPTPPAFTSSLSLTHFAPRASRPKRPRKIVSSGVPPARIAVVGAGLAGLAVTYHLVHSVARVASKRGSPDYRPRITLFDPCQPGTGGASRAAAGLLHPFSPRAKVKVWAGVKSVDAAKALVKAAEDFSGRVLLRTPGVMRLALTDKMVGDFKVAAGRFPRELEFLEPEVVKERCPGAPEGVPAVFMNSANVVDCGGYLQSLWALCEASGQVAWSPNPVDDYRSLLRGSAACGGEGIEHEAFDAVVVCTGAAIKAMTTFDDLPITACRGQNLVLERVAGSQTSSPASMPPMPSISGKYVIPDCFSELPRIVAGATFEYCDDDQDELQFCRGVDTDVEHAKRELAEPLTAIAPGLMRDWRAVGAIAGVRALPPRSQLGSVPLVAPIGDVLPENGSAWVFTGLGSRGILHHAYLGKMLARAVVAGNEKLIPPDARRVAIGEKRL